jgi:2'-5' RNA ligase
MDDPTDHSMYYVAIVCPAGTDEKILRFKHWMKEQFGCMVALKSPAHITLISPFWMEQEKEAGLQQTLQSFKYDEPELVIHLDGYSHFTDRVLFVSVTENPDLEMLKRQTENHFIQSFGNIKADLRPFHPHITIANRDMRPYQFERAWQYFSKKDFKEVFATHTISLLKLISGKWNVIGERTW